MRAAAGELVLWVGEDLDMFLRDRPDFPVMDCTCAHIHSQWQQSQVGHMTVSADGSGVHAMQAMNVCMAWVRCGLQPSHICHEDEAQDWGPTGVA